MIMVHGLLVICLCKIIIIIAYYYKIILDSSALPQILIVFQGSCAISGNLGKYKWDYSLSIKEKCSSCGLMISLMKVFGRVEKRDFFVLEHL